MDFELTEQEKRFRDNLRQWLQAHLPPGWGKTIFEPVDLHDKIVFLKDWSRQLYEAGYAGLSWPKEYGGAGATLMEQVIFNEEVAHCKAPTPYNGIALGMVGPTLIEVGTEAQKQRYLAKMLTCEDIWCQGYSEPGSGSDLASLQTRAVQDGDEFVINGQKVWTSMAHHSQGIFMLARTDPDAPKHRGISYFLVDMQTPGIAVKPLIDMSNGHHFNEVYFENVRVPRSGLLGELHRGWYMATTTLSYERSGIEGPASAGRYVRLLTQYARETQRHGKPMAEDPLLRQRLGQLATEVEVARALAWRIASIQTKGDIPGPEAPALKVFGSELFQRIAQTGMQMLGL